jgi:hypothetical protein
MAQTSKRLAQAALYVALAAAILGAIALPAMAAESRPLLTIADGPAQLLRGALKFDAVEGLALADDDIVRTTTATRVARIEFADGRALDLGPATQVLLLSERAAHAQGWVGATAVVLQGWAKLSAGAAVSRLVLAHGVVVGDGRGVLLVHSAADGAALAFAESRSLALVPRGAGGAELSLREGESWSRDAASAAVRVTPRLTGLREVPRALADTLPRRAALWDGRALDATGGAPIDAAELAPWLQAEPQLLALLRPQRSAATAHAGPSWPRSSSSAVKTVSHSGPRMVVRRLARALPPAKASTSATAIALPPTVLLAAEPVATVSLPNLLSQPGLRTQLSPAQAQ